MDNQTTMWTLDDEMARLRRKLTMVRLVTGTVSQGVVVPDAELPEGARVTVSVGDDEPGEPEETHPGSRALAVKNARLFHELAQCDLP